jgi:hypothetical protein
MKAHRWTASLLAVIVASALPSFAQPPASNGTAGNAAGSLPPPPPPSPPPLLEGTVVNAPNGTNPIVDLRGIDFPLRENSNLHIEGLIRGFYRHDQRIEWSGLESTFGGEGIFRTAVQSREAGWILSAETELFVNQQPGSSILSDAERDLYRDTLRALPPFQVFQAFAKAQYGDVAVRIGRVRTPFGRYDSEMYSNNLFDAPFLRTEIIGFTETGLFLSFTPGPLAFDVAVVNGEADLDTNSSKGLLARVGYNGDILTIGTSIKLQDGISSEFHKRENNFVGIDWAAKFGRWLAYGEVVGDRHGFKRNFNAFGNQLNLGIRSLYGRDVYIGDEVAIYGVGFHNGIAFRGDRWRVDLNYGFYHPQQIGIPTHDQDIHRGVLKGTLNLSDHCQIFGVALVENQRPRVGVLDKYQPWALSTGLQFVY